MKRIGFFLVLLGIVIFLKRDLVESYFIESLEKRFECKLEGFGVNNLKEICFRAVSYKGLKFHNVSLMFCASGLDRVFIDKVDIAFDNNDAQINKPDKPAVTGNLKQKRVTGFFIPKFVYVKQVNYKNFVIDKIFIRRRSRMFSGSCYAYTSSDASKQSKCDVVYNSANGEIFVLCDLKDWKETLKLKINASLSDISKLQIKECSIIDGAAKYTSHGLVDFQNLTASLFYKDIAFQLSYLDKLHVNATYGDILFKSVIDLDQSSALVDVIHGDDVLHAKVNDSGIEAASERIFGIEDVAIVAKDGVLKAYSNVSSSKLNCLARYSYSNMRLNVDINSMNVDNNLFDVKITHPANCLFSINGFKLNFPSFALKSDSIDFIGNFFYDLGKATGSIVISKLMFDGLQTLSGRITLSTIQQSGRINVDGKIDNDKLKIAIRSSDAGIIFDCSYLKSNVVTALLPLVLFADSRLYKFSIDKAEILCKLDADIASVVPQENVKGHVKSDISLVFKDGKPSMTGSLKLKKGLIAFHRYGVVFKDVFINAVGDANKIRIIDAGFFDLKNGIGKISGDVAFSNLDINPNLKLEVFDLCLSDDGALYLVGNGAASLTGSVIDGMFVKGSIEASKAVFKMLGYQSEYQDIDVVHFYGKQKRKVSRIPINIDFDVALICKNLLITGSMMDTNWSGNLVLCGQNKVTFSGDLLIKNGFIKLFNEKFNVKKGKISFNPKYPFNPFLFLQATKNLSNIMVNVSIKKSVSRVDFSLSSRPSMSIENILAHVIFHKPASEMSSTDWAQVGYIMQSSKDGTVFSELNNVFNKIGISNVRLLKQTEEGKGTVSIQTKLSEKISVSVDNDIDNKSTFLKMQTDLSDKISLEASSRGEVGVAYKKRY